jgi:predicted anti-sigma-YlaC factor YlaD
VRSLTCQEVLDQLADYLDEAAHAELVGAVDRHIGSCSHCRVEVDTLRLTVLFYRRGEPIQLPAALATKLQQALEVAYRDGCSRRDGGVSEA